VKPKETSAPPSTDRIRAVLERVVEWFSRVLPEAVNTKPEAKNPDTPAFDLRKRPSGWLGHWSVQYGRVLVRTINLYPPFGEVQSEVLSTIPKPMREALDPVASVAEPMDRDGRLVAWRLTRSSAFDLFGPIGLVVGALVLAIVGFNIAVSLLSLPPLMAQRQAPPPIATSPFSGTGEPTPQQVQPPPTATSPSSGTGEPTPQQVQPPPTAKSPSSGTGEPTPQQVRPPPIATSPSSGTGEPTPQQLQPPPTATSPSSGTGEPTPQQLQPPPKAARPPAKIRPQTPVQNPAGGGARIGVTPGGGF
jgi:hypothetical protein